MVKGRQKVCANEKDASMMKSVMRQAEDDKYMKPFCLFDLYDYKQHC